MTSFEKVKSEIEVQEGWIQFDFSNSDQFEGTVPVYCSVNGQILEGRSWARILVELTEQEIRKNNFALDPLYQRPLLPSSKGRPFFLKEKPERLSCAKLSNGCWLNTNYDIPRLLDRIKALCLLCGYSKKDAVFFGAAKNVSVERKTTSNKVRSLGNDANFEKTEEYLKSCGLEGATVQEIIAAVQPNATESSTRSMLDSSLNVIRRPNGRYAHTDAFVDLDEAEEGIRRILQTHFAQFGGYSNNKLLFGAASHDLSMFLNDNDCEDVDSVYYLAQYFFSKKKTGDSYTFSCPHIFEKTPDFPPTLNGLAIDLARTNGGILHTDDVENYFTKTSLSCPSIVHLLQLSSSDTFLYYDENRFLLTEKIGTNETFQQILHDKLDDLFREADVAYVIPRDVKEAWLQTLPALPLELPWTSLLLQEVLRNYPDIGFRTIASGLNQKKNTIAAAIVPSDSVLQSFSDVVTLYMQEKHTLPKRMTCEELRQELREAGMLQGNELIFTLPKVLNDNRFSWADENKTVLVRGN